MNNFTRRPVLPILIVGGAFVIAVLLILYFSSFVTSSNAEELSAKSNIAIAIFGAVGLITIILAFNNYHLEVSFKKGQLITKLYDLIMKDKTVFDSYIKITESNNLTSSDKNKDNYLVHKILTEFDKIYYFYEKGFIGEKELEYIACEVIELSKSKYVKDEINEVRSYYCGKGYPNKIIPFSDFGKLVKKCEEIIEKERAR